MVDVKNIYGFTGSVWETADIDNITIAQLLELYSHLYYTIDSDGEYHLGERSDVTSLRMDVIASAELVTFIPKTVITAPVELVCSKYRMVDNDMESNGTVYFDDNEKIVICGGNYIPTNDNPHGRYTDSLVDHMVRQKDPVIGTTDVFYDCNLLKITNQEVTDNYSNGLLLIGGILIEVRKLYDFLGSSVTPASGMSGWLPTLYKKVSKSIPSYECGLSRPINLEDLQDVELFNRLVSHRESRLVTFNTPGPVTYESEPISDLFPSVVEGVVCFNDRPSAKRVIRSVGRNISPTYRDNYPVYKDIDDNGSKRITLGQNVKEVSPTNNVIKFIKYEVA